MYEVYEIFFKSNIFLESKFFICFLNGICCIFLLRAPKVPSAKVRESLFFKKFNGMLFYFRTVHVAEFFF